MSHSMCLKQSESRHKPPKTVAIFMSDLHDHVECGDRPKINDLSTWGEPCHSE